MVFYDFEVFKHDWMVVVIDTDTRQTHIIVNSPEKLWEVYEQNKNNIWVGYNSRRYDQYILKAILCGFDPKEVNDWIIEQDRGGWEFSKLLHSIQLYNFDIMTGFHGLKQLEAFMGNSIKETTVPFNIDRKLTPEEIAEVVEYCRHDVEQTMEVFINNKAEFESHYQLLKAFDLPLEYINKTKAQLSAIILGASKKRHRDEFELQIPDTIVLDKYKHILEWYQNPDNLDYEKKLVVDVAGCEHIFAWGGLHGAKKKYHGKGIFINMDVASYYPSLMIEYGFGSRNMENPDKYKEIYETRLKLKAEKNPLQQPYKIVLNATYGAMKDRYNNLYDPRQCNNVCIAGQLMLLDLIEKLEPVAEIIQSNTDGVLVKVFNEEAIDKVKEIGEEWSARTRMGLEYDMFTEVYQKDVNNYVIIDANGDYKSKGAYVKKLSKLDNDLPIVNKALVDYFTKGVPVQKTILECSDLIQFQKVVKVSSKYEGAFHGKMRLNERVLRVFASRSSADEGVFKLKLDPKKKTGDIASPFRIEKIAGTPERCFIINEQVVGLSTPRKLDKSWYVETAVKRLGDFLK